jgi:hypothetical protein
LPPSMGKSRGGMGNVGCFSVNHTSSFKMCTGNRFYRWGNRELALAKSGIYVGPEEWENQLEAANNT